MTIRALKPSPVLLMVLALLSERPMHPYEMQRLVVERGKNAVITIKRGSIYHAVERLRAAGYVEEQETSRDGRRPERTVYRLTDDGEDAVREWMRLLLAKPNVEFPEFATVMSFLPVLEPDEVLSALHHRLVMLDGAIGRTRATLTSVGGRLPRVFLIEEEYQLAMLQAERNWVADLVDDFESGRFTWKWEDFQPYTQFPLRRPGQRTDPDPAPGPAGAPST